MGYPDGYYYGQGRIICDTSTFSVGDTIRVRSMTDSSKVWNQQVATVGTALVFTVPCYDYYKICTVQTINDTPTEIGGVYRTVDYGQTYFINVLDKTTLTGVKGILNAHQHNSLMAVGDEVTVVINGVGVVFQDAGHDLYESNEIIFVAKEIQQLSQFNSSATANGYANSTIRGVVQTIFSQINETDKALIDSMTRYGLSYYSTYLAYSDKLWIPSMYEAAGFYYNNLQPPVAQHQFPIFMTQASRVKQFNGTSKNWWTNDSTPNTHLEIQIMANGDYDVNLNETSQAGVLPCFHLVADS